MNVDLIIHNAKIYTVDPDLLWAEAVAMGNGRILAVGRNDEILPLAGPETELLDGNGRLVLPGFTDSHVHFLQVAIRNHQTSLFGMADFTEVRETVRTAVSQANPGEWVQGWGWDENLWPRLPSRAHLDDIAPHNPVALARMDMHTWWVNNAALKLAGITNETPDPPESKIERDENGQPTGILREWNAIELVERHIPEPDKAALAGWLEETITLAHSLGLTGIHDQRVENEGDLSFRLFQALNRAGKLNLRLHMNIAAERLPQAAALGLQPGFGDDRLWIGHVKSFADGTMGSQTAHMLEPFSSDPTNTGIAVTPADEMWQLAVAASEAGFPISIHAIGDRAVREVLDVCEELTGRRGEEVKGRLFTLSPLHPLTPAPLPMPHRIEHVQLLHPDDVERLAQLGVVAAMQPVHLQTDWPTADRVWGERARLTYAFRSLLDGGTILAFGSDAPVAPLNPMLGVFTAVTRQDNAHQPTNGWYPQERISLEETIYAYTMGPAILSGKQHVQGSITPGKWADLIVLEQNLFEIEAAKIAETEVNTTIFAGAIVYPQKSFN
jgi:predicted amidohydrolase YtcJ